MIVPDVLSDKQISSPLYTSSKRRKSSIAPTVVHLDLEQSRKISEESKSETDEEEKEKSSNGSPSKRDLETKFLPFPDNWIQN